MVNNNCGQCGRFASVTDGAKCTKCNSLFHRDCVKLSPKGHNPCTWICNLCLKGKNKQNKQTSVPAAKGSSTSVPNLANLLDVSSSPNTVAPPKSASVSMEVDSANIVNELRLLRTEMVSFRGEITKLSNMLAEFNSRVDNIESRLSRLEERSSESGEIRNSSSVQSTISQLQAQLNDRDQDLLMNDVQISGLQEFPGENLNSLSCVLARKLGVEIDVRDIVSAVRAGPRRGATAVVSDGEQVQPRARPIVVRLARRAVRDELLRAARVRRGADTSGIIDGEPRRFYINEHLTRTNKYLFFKAREEGRNRNFRFIWTRDGHIYMRQSDKAIVYRVRTEADLGRIFNNTSF